MSAPASSQDAPVVAAVQPVARRRRSPGRLLGAGVTLIGLIIVASAVGHFLLPGPNEQDLLAPLQAPSLHHLFGTDELGRDVLSRTLSATWLDLSFGILVTAISVSVGVIVGSASGYIGGAVERVVMRLVDAVIGFPYMIYVLAMVAIIGPGILGLIVALASLGWAFYARVARGEMLGLRESQFIQAARTLGFPNRRIIIRHAIPNLLRPIAVYSMSDIVFNILAIAGLSFLGLGVPPPTPEWGAIIADGQAYVLSAWWISALPGLVVVVVGLGFVLIGDALSERLGVQRESRLG
jgi:peptide/nickel transport system permease protein